MRLTDILSPACILAPMRAADKDGAIRELIDLLDDQGLLADKAAAMEAVMQREQLRTTGIGNALAVPHGKCEAVNQPVLAIGRPAEPIDFDSIDGKPVDVVVLLISPPDQPGEHIHVLAKISRLLTHEATRAAVAEANSREAIYDVLTCKDEQPTT